MSIQNDSKKIIDLMLGTVIKQGSLMSSFFIKCDELTAELNLDSENYCVVCLHYLHQLGYIKIVRNDSGTRLVELTAQGIDFLESTTPSAW